MNFTEEELKTIARVAGVEVKGMFAGAFYVVERDALGTFLNTYKYTPDSGDDLIQLQEAILKRFGRIKITDLHNGKISVRLGESRGIDPHYGTAWCKLALEIGKETEE